MASRKNKKKALPQLRDPLTGYFAKASLAAARKIERTLAKLYRQAQSLRNKAARQRFGGAKLASTRKKQDKAYRDAARQVARIGQKLTKAQDQLSDFEATSRRLPKVVEVGVSYNAKSGASSDVNFNIRIRRKGAGGVSDKDVRRVLEAIASGDPNQMPRGFEVTGMDWSSPGRKRKYERTSQDGDNVWSFSDIVGTVLAEKAPLRIGEPKDDRIGL